MAMTIDRPCTPVKSLEISLKEMKMIKQGDLRKKNWRTLFNELKDEDINEE